MCVACKPAGRGMSVSLADQKGKPEFVTWRYALTKLEYFQSSGLDIHGRNSNSCRAKSLFIQLPQHNLQQMDSQALKGEHLRKAVTCPNVSNSTGAAPYSAQALKGIPSDPGQTRRETLARWVASLVFARPAGMATGPLLGAGALAEAQPAQPSNSYAHTTRRARITAHTQETNI